MTLDMTFDRTSRINGTRTEPAIRINLVGDDHEHWPGVLAHLTRTGRHESLLVGEGGGLSARQNVLAAFAGDDVVGHVAFHVLPAEEPDGQVARENGRAIVEARLNSLGVTPGLTESALNTLRKLLVNAARTRAEQLRVGRLVGFDPAE